MIVPVLSTVIPKTQISTNLIAALDARESERASFMALGLYQDSGYGNGYLVLILHGL